MLTRRMLTVVLLIGAVPAFAQALTIVAPAPGTSVRPGQSVTVVAAPEAGETLTAVQAGPYQRSLSDLQPQPDGTFAGTVTVPTEAVGPLLVVVAGRRLDGRLTLDSRTLVVEPGLVRMINVHAPPVLTFVGQVERVDVTAAFEDAVLRDVSGDERGSSYASSDPAVLGVHPEGYIQARAAGSAELTVTNRGVTGSIFVTVAVPSPPDNGIPIPNPGPDRTVPKNLAVDLDGSGSSDPDGDALQYQWQQVGGIQVQLVDESSAHARFSAPYVTEPSVITFALAVRDSKGATSFPALVRITVTP